MTGFCLTFANGFKPHKLGITFLKKEKKKEGSVLSPLLFLICRNDIYIINYVSIYLPMIQICFVLTSVLNHSKQS